ncbi:uncharacterized protein LOC102800951 [Saccoglossus kowalevskii]|uniref:Zinc finger protein 800-like n=1 Tax=Saccoglossus kowalevskii TaxID=10224 RepID=A0ABM0N034_SACKO|nr:PREDICTED: zinc finger protein 800-like [Saccoglossus kowalevskii]
MANIKPSTKDHTLLQKPVLTAKNGVQQIFDCFRYGTRELKVLLQHEVDLIYECRICRSLYRGLPNFIDHKKSYCTTRISVTNDIATSNPNSDVQNIFRRESEEMPQLELEVSEGTEKKANTADDIVGHNYCCTPVVSEPLVVTRPIQTTTKAVYQQLIKPVKKVDLRDRIMTAKQKTGTSPPSSHTIQSRADHLDTTSLIDEISARRAANAGIMVVQPECPDKKYETRNVRKTEVKKEAKRIYKPKVVLKKKPEVKKKVQSTSGKPKNFAASRIQNLKPYGRPSSNQCICLLCKKACKNRTSLAWHMRVHSKHLYKCPICQYYNYSSDYLRQHMLLRHESSEAEIEKVIENRITTKQDVNIQSDKEVAAYTLIVKDGKKMLASKKVGGSTEAQVTELSPSELKIKKDVDETQLQKMTIEMEKESELKLPPVVKFPQPSLTLHPCSICGKSFASKRNLARHEKQHLLKAEEEEEEVVIKRKKPLKPLKNVSSKPCMNVDQARADVEALMNVKNLKCLKCGKQLYALTSLRKHVRSHFGYNSYTCRFCPQFITTDYSNLKRHLARKHAKKFRNPEQIRSAISTMKSGIWLSINGSGAPRSNGPNCSSPIAVKKESPEKHQECQTSPGGASVKSASSTGGSPNNRGQARLERIPFELKCDQVVKSGSGHTNPAKMAAIAKIISEKHMRCERCKKKFESMQLLKKHAARHLGYHTFKCKFCKFVSHSYSWFKNHLRKDHLKKVKSEEQLRKLMRDMRVMKM